MIYARTRKLHEFPLFHHKRPLLAHLDIELTERCNNACIHCYINQPEWHAEVLANEMDKAFAKGVLKQAISLGCLMVRLTDLRIII